MIEKIIMVGVIWNGLLQTAWFVWTLKKHKDSKHER